MLNGKQKKMASRSMLKSAQQQQIRPKSLPLSPQLEVAKPLNSISKPHRNPLSQFRNCSPKRRSRYLEELIVIPSNSGSKLFDRPISIFTVARNLRMIAREMMLFPLTPWNSPSLLRTAFSGCLLRIRKTTIALRCFSLSRF